MLYIKLNLGPCSGGIKTAADEKVKKSIKKALLAQLRIERERLREIDYLYVRDLSSDYVETRFGLIDTDLYYTINKVGKSYLFTDIYKAGDMVLPISLFSFIFFKRNIRQLEKITGKSFIELFRFFHDRKNYVDWSKREFFSYEDMIKYIEQGA